MKQTRRSFIKRSGIAALVATNTLLLTGLVDAEVDYYSSSSIECKRGTKKKCCNDKFGSNENGFKCETTSGDAIEGYCDSSGNNWTAEDCPPDEEDD